MKISKKILSSTLAGLMVLSALPLSGMTASAADLSSYTKITGTTTISESGNYYLDSDVTGNLTISSGVTATLDLNGHVLKASSTNSPVITDNGKLTIEDSNTSAVHYYTVNSNNVWVWNDSNTTNAKSYESLTARPSSGDVIAVKGGCITGASYSYPNHGAGIDAFYSGTSVTLNSGNIIGNYHSGSGAGGIHSYYGDVIVNGGLIAGNYSNGSGGGIHDNAGAIKMTGGSVSFNTGNWGGGINSNWNTTQGFTMTGGTISYNYSSAGGGGVHVAIKCYLSGGKIVNNIAVGNGGGVYYGTALTIGGNIDISNNQKGTETNNLYVPSDKNLVLGDDTTAPKLTSGAKIGVTLESGTGQFTTNGTLADEAYFFSDNTAYEDVYNTSGYMEIKAVDCVTFKSADSFTLKISPNNRYTINLQYSTDKNTWTNITTSSSSTTSISSSGGSTHVLYLRGTGNTAITGFPNSSLKWAFDGGASGIYGSGNLMNLLDYTNPDGVTMASNAFAFMFSGCTNLKTAPSILTSKLSSDCCYYMFEDCTALTTAPVLKAKTLADSCYFCMFHGCTGLTTAPELSATSLATSCYQCMFYDCSSLKTAPALPAETLATYCYSAMFYGCSALETAPELPATELTARCYRQMFYNCTSLTRLPNLSHVTSAATYSMQEMFKGCTGIKLYTTGGDSWTSPNVDPYYMTNMLKDTGGDVTGTPSQNTKYYYTKLNVTVDTVTGGTVTASTTTPNEGDTVTLTATPSTGYKFDSYKVVKTGTSTEVTVTGGKFTMPASDVTVTATFTKVDYTVTADTVTGGTVTADKTTANYGDTVTLTATTKSGYKFKNFVVNGSSLKGNTFTMPAKNVTVSAVFEAIPAVVNAKYYASLTLNDNVDVNFTIKNIDTANFELDKLTINDCAVDASAYDSTNGTVSVLLSTKKLAELAKSDTISVKYDGTEVKSVTYSIRNYCNSVFNSASYGEDSDLGQLCKSILNLGAKADEQFNGGTSTFNEDYELNFNDISISAKDIKKTDALNSAQLKLDEGVAMKLSYTTSSEVSASDFKIVNNLGEYVTADNITVEKTSTGYDLIVSNMGATKLSRNYTVTCANDSSLNATVSVYALCKLGANNTSYATLANLYKALYNYGECAKAFPVE